jgi:hypothetical protein
VHTVENPLVSSQRYPSLSDFNLLSTKFLQIINYNYLTLFVFIYQDSEPIKQPTDVKNRLAHAVNGSKIKIECIKIHRSELETPFSSSLYDS